MLRYSTTAGDTLKGRSMASKSYSNITEAIFSCVKEKSSEQHGTVYNPPDADKGTATTKTAVGTVTLTFALDTATSTLTYEITDKPFVVTDSEVWDGINGTISSCRSSG